MGALSGNNHLILYKTTAKAIQIKEGFTMWQIKRYSSLSEIKHIKKGESFIG
jgi:hypothetical protein